LADLPFAGGVDLLSVEVDHPFAEDVGLPFAGGADLPFADLPFVGAGQRAGADRVVPVETVDHPSGDVVLPFGDAVPPFGDVDRLLDREQLRVGCHHSKDILVARCPGQASS
jgi:hypothetical protein